MALTPDERKQLDEDFAALKYHAGAVMGEVSKYFSVLGESGRRTNATLATTNSIFSGMRGLLLGPVGVAAGLYSAAKSLENFAQSEVALRTFATTTRFTTSNISSMRQGMERLGMSSAEADRIIGGLGARLNNLAAFKESSELWRTLSQSVGGADLANRLKELSQAGDQMGAVNEILRTFQRQTVQAKIALSEYLDMPMGVLENLSKAMDRNVAGWEKNEAAADHWHNRWIDISKNLDNVWKSVAGHTIDAIGAATGTLEQEGQLARATADFINKEIDGILAGIRTSIDEFKQIKRFLTGEFLLNTKGSFLRQTPAEAVGLGSFESYRGNEAINMDAMRELLGAPGRSRDNVTPGGFRGLRRRFDRDIRDSITPEQLQQLGGGSGNDVMLGGQDKDELFTRANFIELAANVAERRLNRQPGVVSMLDYRGIPSAMKRDSQAGHPMRTRLRSMLGIDDPGEPAPWQAGGSFNEVRELKETEEDSNRVLRDMRDSLQRMEGGEGGSRGALFRPGVGQRARASGGAYDADSVFPKGFGGGDAARSPGGAGAAGGGAGAGAGGVNRKLNAESASDLMRGLQERGFSQEDAAAVVGNLDAESSLKPGIVNRIGAVGLMQWLGARKRGLFNFARSTGRSPYERDVQLDWIKMERSGESVQYGGSDERKAFDRALGSGTVAERAARFGALVERPSAWELRSSMSRRTGSANRAFEIGASDAESRSRIDKTQSQSSGPWGKINAAIDFLNMPQGVRQETTFSGDAFAATRVSVERAPQGALAGGETAKYSPWSIQ